MIRIKWILILTLFTVAAGNAAAIGNFEWRDASLWIGKYPSATAGGNKMPLLDQPLIRAILKKTLPKEELAALGRFKVEVPVREMEGFIVVNKCLPHNCPADNATVVIDVLNQRIWVGLFSREEARVSTRWYSIADDYSVLPDSIKKDFLARHGD